MSINVTPLSDRIVVKQMAAEDKIGGIIIPDTAKEKPNRGTVIVCGPGKSDEPMEVKPNDTVLYNKGAGIPLTINEEDYLIMRQGDVLAII